MSENILYRRSREDLAQVMEGSMVAFSTSTQNILKQLRALGGRDCAVMICGESGTGKELIARYCHKVSGRVNGPFVAVNCAALPDDLLESELFGHLRGSFTGAFHDHDGLIRQAHGGTLFLDEIGDMSLRTQAKLLRVIQEKKVRPVGGGEEKSVDFRIICATHKNMLSYTRAGGFRMDLYFRLSVIPVHVAPLRARPEDIIPLALHFINKWAVANKVAPKQLSKAAEARLLNHAWAGNVREVGNVIERAMVFSAGPTVEVEDIVFDSDYLGNADSNDAFLDMDLDVDLRGLEKQAIIQALRRCDGIKTRAAQMLGIDRKTLLRKEREYNLCQGSSVKEKPQ